jgi:hypothetical protein
MRNLGEVGLCERVGKKWRKCRNGGDMGPVEAVWRCGGGWTKVKRRWAFGVLGLRYVGYVKKMEEMGVRRR